jgi:HD-GYP domain-containing protein (c-di-GMP phosphodiesterase class II)
VLARAAFHDIGKMAIPDKILREPGPPDDAEKVIMRTHCEIGYNTLTRVPFLWEAADIVLAHHEFFDGTGYPRGLRGEQIPLGSRIISIANTFDTMLSDRPYRNALPMSYAFEEIRQCAVRNSTQRLWRFFSPFQRATGSIFVKASAHPSA